MLDYKRNPEPESFRSLSPGASVDGVGRLYAYFRQGARPPPRTPPLRPPGKEGLACDKSADPGACGGDVGVCCYKGVPESLGSRVSARG